MGYISIFKRLKIGFKVFIGERPPLCFEMKG
jgi:hypothetical protein